MTHWLLPIALLAVNAVVVLGCGLFVSAILLQHLRTVEASHTLLIEELGAVVHAIERIAVVLETRGDPSDNA